MKKRLAACATAVILIGSVGVCAAADNSVETVTNAMESFQTEITLKSDNIEQVFRDVFDENPELFYYFGGIDSPSSTGKKRDVQITYLYTDVNRDSIFVVNDSTDLYNVVGLALMDTLTEVPIVVTDSTITTETIVDTIDQWRTDHYLTYMGFDGASASIKSAEISTWTAYTLTLDYAAEPETVQAWRTATENKVVELCGSLFAQDMPDYQKELLIHDYIVENCTYEETADNKEQYTAYGCLVDGKAVCEGYAEAARLLFDAAGLESYYVEGAGTSADHAWNSVKIEDQYYWVDLTWDDPTPAAGESETVEHSYFNLTDSQLNQDHSWQYAKYPSAVSTTWNYDAVVEALTPEEGEELPTYSDYTAKNVTTLATLRSDLIYQLGIDEEAYAAALAAAPAETQAEETEAAESTAPETSGAQADTADQSAKSGGKGWLVLIVILALLVAAYMVYRRIMYLRMMARRRARNRAKRNAQRQGQAQTQNRPRQTQSRPRQATGTARKPRPKSTHSGSSVLPRKQQRTRRKNPYRSEE